MSERGQLAKKADDRSVLIIELHDPDSVVVGTVSDLTSSSATADLGENARANRELDAAQLVEGSGDLLVVRHVE
jgi:hypothetical protein